jgi:anaerobic ribonucleoside-triphosphate reductase
MKKRDEILKEHRKERTKCSVYTRVMGYHRPVETFNIGKKGEFSERKHFKEDSSLCC